MPRLPHQNPSQILAIHQILQPPKQINHFKPIHKDQPHLKKKQRLSLREREAQENLQECKAEEEAGETSFSQSEENLARKRYSDFFVKFNVSGKEKWRELIYDGEDAKIAEI